MCRRWLRVGAFGMAVVVAGCATAPPNPSVGAIAPGSQAPTECTTSPSSGNGVARLGRAIGYGTVGVFLGALQGASDGAGWAWTTGGSGSHGAWIGAAAGAGIGFLIGFVAGLAKADSGWSSGPAASSSCPQALAETTVPAEGD
jgi:hypothetical protein